MRDCFKRLAAATLFSTAVTAVHAQSVPTDQTKDCSIIGEAARTMMDARQTGYPLSEMMKIAEQSGDISSVAKQLVIAAYKVPQYATEEGKRNAASEFQNTAELACFTAHP